MHRSIEVTRNQLVSLRDDVLSQVPTTPSTIAMIERINEFIAEFDTPTQKIRFHNSLDSMD
tara:strand:- start:49 stop:231 length:183 start_codon:yes stop_codon:yes gene_type:complete